MPTHQLAEAGTFFVTAATYQKEHYFRARGRLDVLHRGLLTVARDFGWPLEAWAVFSNHYHSPTTPEASQKCWQCFTPGLRDG
jgi:putative transposase